MKEKRRDEPLLKCICVCFEWGKLNMVHLPTWQSSFGNVSRDKLFLEMTVLFEWYWLASHWPDISALCSALPTCQWHKAVGQSPEVVSQMTEIHVLKYGIFSYYNIKVSKVGDHSRRLPESLLFISYYIEVWGRTLLLSLDCSTLPLIHTL